MDRDPVLHRLFDDCPCEGCHRFRLELATLQKHFGAVEVLPECEVEAARERHPARVA